MNYRWAIGGGLFGLALDDTLKAFDLHWLVWPVVGALAVLALTGSLIAQRRQRR